MIDDLISGGISFRLAGKLSHFSCRIICPLFNYRRSASKDESESEAVSRNYLNFRDSVLRKDIFVLLPQASKFLYILGMKVINVRFVNLVSVTLLNDLYRSANDNIQRTSIRHQSHVIIENPTSMKERNCEPHRTLNEHLKLVYNGMLI